MNYKVVFDVAQEGYQFDWLLFGLGGIVVLAGMWLFFYKRSPRPFPLAIVGSSLGFVLLWTLLASTGTFASYSKLSSALREGRCAVVEGTVTKFHPMPYGGHQMEWFVVEGQRFEYSDHMETGGFNNTQSHGGPIRLGIQVRVRSVDGTIARLEVAP